MSDIDRPPYCNHAFWIQHFREKRNDENRFLTVWRDEARALVAARAKPREWRQRDDWWDMSNLLVVWCDHHPEVKIDPTAFQVLQDCIWRKFHDGKGAACHEALKKAMYPLQRLQLTNGIWSMRLAEALQKKKLTSTQTAIAKLIDAANGIPLSLKEIRLGLSDEGITRETISRALAEMSPLWARGYRESEVEGKKGYRKQIV